MLWAVYAVMSAFFSGMFRLIEKRTLRKEHAAEFSVVLGITTVLISIPILFFINVYIEPVMILFTYIAALLWSTALILDTKALRHMDISNFAPLLNIHPMFVALISFFVLGEVLSFPQLLGLVLIAMGAYVLRYKQHIR